MGVGDPTGIVPARDFESSASTPIAAPDQRGTTSASRAEDLQSLVSDALRRLAETTASTRACAWAERADGQPYVLAARFRDQSSVQPPDTEAMAALRTVFADERAVDLGARGETSPLAQLARRHGLSSAMPLLSTHGERIAMLLLGGDEDQPGRVRPRTLAALASAAERLRAPITASAALARLNALDAEVCRLDRLSVLGDLLTEVAHEIRNPLVSMKTFLHLLPQRRDDAEFTGDFREVVLEELARMERLLDTLLEHARPAANRTGEAALEAGAQFGRVFDSLARLLEQRAHEREIELASEIDPALGDMAIGEDALRQVLMNLVLNALDASPASSRVVVRAGAAEQCLAFSVEDQGPGIPASIRARLFEPFFTTRDDRVGGLGLAITKKLVENAGGRIYVEDAAHGGARFCVEVPWSAASR